MFRDNGRGGLSYLTQQPIKYIPIGDKIELNLGADPEVIFELIKLRAFRDELWLQIHGTSEYRKIGGDGVMRVENASLAGWDDHEIFTQRIRNYTSKPIEVEIRRTLPGHIVFKSQLEPKLHDYQTAEFLTRVAAGQAGRPAVRSRPQAGHQRQAEQHHAPNRRNQALSGADIPVCHGIKSCASLLPIIVARALCGICRRAADNIDLSTVPSRDTVQLTIYNSEDLTLVRETRKVTFKKGANPLQFSWANTLIDPTSVELKFLTQADQLVRARHDVPACQAANAVLERAERIRRRSDDPDHLFHQRHHLERRLHLPGRRGRDEMGLEGFVRVHNNSGEEYENAQVRLVVGTINLVEKIAQLANITPGDVANMPRDQYHDLRLKAMDDAVPSMAQCSGSIGRSGDAAPKEIIKEGLSEYFIYTIEGTETIRTAGRSGCGRSRARRCRSRFNTATGRPNMASSWSACIC